VRIVAIVLVRNEDLFVERAIQNVAPVCDRIHAVDHVSTDATWEILRRLAVELDHLDVRRARHSRVSHEVLEPYMGTDTWALRVDGDELYDPDGLERMRGLLESGAFDHAFRVQANVLHCVSLDRGRRVASGYLSPPSRPITSLFNLGAVDSWTGPVERLEGGQPMYRPGYDLQTVIAVPDRYSWDESPLRYLHVCFLPRSGHERPGDSVRRNLTETGYHRRGVAGDALRLVRRPRLNPQIREIHERNSDWKRAKYRRGPLVEKDVSAFFPSARRANVQASAYRCGASSSSSEPVNR